MSDSKNSRLTYAESGVDIKAGEEAVARIKKLAASTFNDQVIGGVGSFGAMFRPNIKDLAEPVLVSSTDSVGTKLKLAFMTGKNDTVGEDLVHHCVNDILVQGARPLFFLDYIAAAKVEPEKIAEIVEGVSRGCRNSGMALIGGETAELPDFYQPDEYDLVGFVVGMVDRSKIVDGSRIVEGDICIGLASNGLHTNGYTLARKVAFDIARLKPDDRVKELGATIAEALMQVHRLYLPVVQPLLERYDIHGMAHITGGGIAGNLKRILPDGMQAEIDKSSWAVPPLFSFLSEKVGIDEEDIYSAFNMGIGYVLVVSSDDATSIMNDLGKVNESAYRIGTIKTGSSGVRLIG